MQTAVADENVLISHKAQVRIEGYWEVSPVEKQLL